MWNWEKAWIFWWNFNLNNPPIDSLLKPGIEVLKGSPRMKTILQLLKFIHSRRQPLKLQQLLVRSKFSDNQNITVSKCGRKNAQRTNKSWGTRSTSRETPTWCSAGNPQCQPSTASCLGWHWSIQLSWVFLNIFAVSKIEVFWRCSILSFNFYPVYPFFQLLAHSTEWSDNYRYYIYALYWPQLFNFPL